MAPLLSWLFTILCAALLLWGVLSAFFGSIRTPDYFAGFVIYFLVSGFVYFNPASSISFGLFNWATGLFAVWPLWGLITGRRCDLSYHESISNGWRIHPDQASASASRWLWILLLVVLVVTYFHFRQIWNVPKMDPLFPFKVPTR